MYVYMCVHIYIYIYIYISSCIMIDGLASEASCCYDHYDYRYDYHVLCLFIIIIIDR